MTHFDLEFLEQLRQSCVAAVEPCANKLCLRPHIFLTINEPAYHLLMFYLYRMEWYAHERQIMRPAVAHPCIITSRFPNNEPLPTFKIVAVED